MNEQQRRNRNRQRLSQLYQPFAEQIKGVIAELEAAGYRPRIQEAYRTPADQLIAYLNGFSKLRYGFHNVTGTGGKPEGLAVDLYDDDRPLNPTTTYLLRLSAASWSRGLNTGVLWGLTTRQRQIVTSAINGGEWQKNVRTGWDAWHIEPRGLTATQARQGKRPKFTAPQPVVPPKPPVAKPYTVVFDNGHAVTAPIIKDRAWLPLRAWGEHTKQAVIWQGEGKPILMGGRPYTGEMQVVRGQTISPVRDLAAYAGLELEVNLTERRITVLPDR